MKIEEVIFLNQIRSDGQGRGGTGTFANDPIKIFETTYGVERLVGDGSGHTEICWSQLRLPNEVQLDPPVRFEDGRTEKLRRNSKSSVRMYSLSRTEEPWL